MYITNPPLYLLYHFQKSSIFRILHDILKKLKNAYHCHNPPMAILCQCSVPPNPFGEVCNKTVVFLNLLEKALFVYRQLSSETMAKLVAVQIVNEKLNMQTIHILTHKQYNCLMIYKTIQIHCFIYRITEEKAYIVF